MDEAGRKDFPQVGLYKKLRYVFRLELVNCSVLSLPSTQFIRATKGGVWRWMRGSKWRQWGLAQEQSKGAREGDGAPPAPHFPTPAVSKGLSCKFTMALALRLVNDTPRYVDARDNRIVPAKSAGCQKFLSCCCRFLPCLEPVRWDEGGAGRL